MLGLFQSLGLLSMLAGCMAAEDTAISIDFFTDVFYNPPDAWSAGLNDPCETVDHYTSTLGATAAFTFSGNQFQISGMRNNVSGIFTVNVDDQEPFVLDLHSDDPTCGLFVDYFLGNGTHNVSVALTSVSSANALQSDIVPVLHMTEITYFIPGSATAAQPSTVGSLSDTSSSSHKSVAAIVAGTIGGVLGVIIIALGLFYFFKRRLPVPTRKSRHSFDPNAVYITELSPRTPTTADSSAKFQPYMQMDDDVEEPKVAHLTVLPSGFGASRGGLRSRSRSPMPGDRKPVPLA